MNRSTKMAFSRFKAPNTNLAHWVVECAGYILKKTVYINPLVYVYIYILNTSIYRYIINYYYPLIALKDPYFCLNKLGGIRIRLSEAPKFPYLFWGESTQKHHRIPPISGHQPKKKTSKTQSQGPYR